MNWATTLGLRRPIYPSKVVYSEFLGDSEKD